MKQQPKVPYTLGTVLHGVNPKHTVVFDGEILTVEQRGLTMALIGGHAVSIPVAQLVGVDFHRPVGFGPGWLRFDTANSARPVRPFEMRNALVIEWAQNAISCNRKTVGLLEGLRDAVLAAIAAHSAAAQQGRANG